MSPRRGGAAVQQQAIGLRKRRSIRSSASDEDHVENANDKKRTIKNSRGQRTGRSRLPRRNSNSTALNDRGQTSDSDDDDHDNETDESEDDDEDDEPNEFAPSGTSRKKRGHQTGLSVSLSNTKIDGGVTTRKRAWSNRVDEIDEMLRPSKTSKEDAGNLTLTSDDEDDYDAVDLISESEDDEEHLEQEEENLIIQSEEEKDQFEAVDGLEDQNFGSLDEFASGDVSPIEEGTFFSENFTQAVPLASGVFASPEPDANQESSTTVTSPVTRRVRFADEVHESFSSNDSGSHKNNDILSNLFMPQDSLSSDLRRNIELDVSTSATDALLGNVGLPESVQLELECLYPPEREGSSSGYETDEGETTDEEAMTPVTVNRPQALLHYDSKATPSRTQSASSSAARRAPVAPMSTGRRQGPHVGSWIADPTKAIAIVDKTGKNMIFYPAQLPKKAAVPSRAASITKSSPTRPSSSMGTSMYESEVDKSDNSSQTMLAQSPANLMMSGLHGTEPDLKGILAGPAFESHEMFSPRRLTNANGNHTGVDLSAYYFNDSDSEACLDIHDIIDFGETSESDCESSKSSSVVVSNKSHSSPTAFRRNQGRSQAHGGRLSWTSEPKSPSLKQKQHHGRGSTLVI